MGMNGQAMSRNIGILNYKGGTGKTTTAINLSAGLALQGKRVLCIDLDPQGSLAAQLGIKPGANLADLFLDRATLQACIYGGRDNLDILPGSRKLLKAEGKLWKMESSSAARRILAHKLKDIQSAYDFLIVDFPPSANKISENGLMLVKELLIPMPMSHLALVGTYQVIGTLKAISRIPNHQLRLSWILPTLYNSRLRKDQSILKSIERQFPDQVADPIRSNVRLAEAPAFQKTIYEYAPRSFGAKDYAALVERVAGSDSTRRI
jgi:chromosome partitioning protein